MNAEGPTPVRDELRDDHPTRREVSLLSKVAHLLPSPELLKRVISLLSGVGAIIVGLSLFIFWIISMIFLLREDQLWTSVLSQNFAAVIGIPLAAAAAFALVSFLEQTRGSIEFEIGWVKFRGASGPLVMWFLVFMSFVLALALLWQ